MYFADMVRGETAEAASSSAETARMQEQVLLGEALKLKKVNSNLHSDTLKLRRDASTKLRASDLSVEAGAAAVQNYADAVNSARDGLNQLRQINQQEIDFVRAQSPATATLKQGSAN